MSDLNTLPRISAYRRGFTLIELITVAMVLLTLIALLWPAVQSAREMARATSCRNNLFQLATALHNYEGQFRMLPPGAVVGESHADSNTEPTKIRLSWIVRILPYLEQRPLYYQFDFRDPRRSMLDEETLAILDQPPVPEDEGSSGLENAPPFMDSLTDEDDVWAAKWPELYLDVLSCPSAWGTSIGIPPSNYVACFSGTTPLLATDSDGTIGLNSSVSLDDIPDGRTTTILVGECRPLPRATGWPVGNRHTMRSTAVPLDAHTTVPFSGGLAPGPDFEPEYGFGSAHAKRSQFAFCDGSVRWLSHDIRPDVFSHLGTRNDGAIVSGTDF